MDAVSPIPRVTSEQYLLLLEMSHTKLEWLDGIAYAMAAGGTLEHSHLALRIGQRASIPSIDLALDVDELYFNPLKT